MKNKRLLVVSLTILTLQAIAQHELIKLNSGWNIKNQSIKIE